MRDAEFMHSAVRQDNSICSELNEAAQMQHGLLRRVGCEAWGPGPSLLETVAIGRRDAAGRAH